MTDNDAGAGQDPNASGEQDSTKTNDAGEQDSKPTGFDALPKETQDEIRKLRRESAGLRTKVQQFEDANKTELQKREDAIKAADGRASAAERRLQDANARSAVTDAATKANAISTRAVYALIRADLDFDDDGEPTNVSALIAQAKKDEPSLFRAAAGSGDGGVRSGDMREISPGLDRLSHAYETSSKTAQRR